MENKEKRVEEMAYIIENAFKVYFGANDLVEPEDFPYQAKDLAKELLEYYQPKLPEDSVVLPKSEYQRLQNLLTKRQNVIDSYKKCIDKRNSAIKQACKEIVEKYFNSIIEVLKEIKTFETIDIKDLVFLHEKNKEIAKQLGMKGE